MRPRLTGLCEALDWGACEAYEDYVYMSCQDVSEQDFDVLVAGVRELYDEYYELYEA